MATMSDTPANRSDRVPRLVWVELGWGLGAMFTATSMFIIQGDRFGPWLFGGIFCLTLLATILVWKSEG